jgi:hypothetical protein
MNSVSSPDRSGEGSSYLLAGLTCQAPTNSFVDMGNTPKKNFKRYNLNVTCPLKVDAFLI